MSSATEYQPVATTTTTQEKRCCGGTCKGICGEIVMCLFCLTVIAGFVVPFIVFRVLRIEYVNSFKPGFCRVNSIGTHSKFGRGINPIWGVDIVQQSKTNIITKDVVVLRASVEIWGPKDYTTTSSALEDAQKLYSVGKVYPCYVRKLVLDDTNYDRKALRSRGDVRWEKP